MIKRRKLGKHTISPRIPENTGVRKRIKLSDLLTATEDFVSEYLTAAAEYHSDINTNERDGYFTVSVSGLAYAIRLLVSHTADNELLHLYFTRDGDELTISMIWGIFAIPESEVQYAVKRALLEAGFEVEFDINGVYSKIKIDSTRALQLYEPKPLEIRSDFYTVFFV